MGQMYKGRDTRLDRIVAIKVLKGQFSERFEREARALLNHINVKPHRAAPTAKLRASAAPFRNRCQSP